MIPTAENGLKKHSIIRLAKITTLEKDLVIGWLGRIANEKLREVDKNLKRLFALK